MFKLTIIAFVVMGSMAFTQSGKASYIKESVHSNKSNRLNVSGDSHKAHSNVATVDQKGKEKKGESKSNTAPNQQKKPQQGSYGKVSPKSNNGSTKFITPQKQDHGKSGGKKGNYNGSHGGGKKDYYSGKPGNLNSGKKHHASKGFKGHNKHYGKGHPNFGYLYINTPGFYSPQNYGQWRSKEAKKKHKNYHPVYEYQAVEGFNFIIVRNNFLYAETRNKIVLVRSGLLRQRNAGIITVVEYDRSIQRVYALEQRRVALAFSITL